MTSPNFTGIMIVAALAGAVCALVVLGGFYLLFF